MRLGQDFALLLSATSQVPLMSTTPPKTGPATGVRDFEFRTGDNIFSPLDLVTLPRPGNALVSPDGALVVVPVSTYDLDQSRNNKTLWIASTASTVNPLEVALARGGEAFWLDSHTLGQVVRPADNEPPQLLARDVEYSLGRGGSRFTRPIRHRELHTVKLQDQEWNNRGYSALVYEETFARHWDTWATPKKPSLFSIRLEKSDSGKFFLGDKFNSILKDTDLHSPVEPFGGSDCFDVSNNHVIFTAKDPSVQPAWHTRQNIYVVPLEGGETKHLTNGKHGATSSPVFSVDGSKVAWLEMAKDGNEADKNQIIVHDFTSGLQIQLSAHWQLSPGAVLFSHDDSNLILTTGEQARTRIFTLKVPQRGSGRDLDADDLADLEPYATSKKRHSVKPDVKPKRLTRWHAAGAVQRAGSTGALVFTQSSSRGPNNAFVVRPSGGSMWPTHSSRVQPEAHGAFVTGEQAVDQEEHVGWTVEQITDFALRRLGPKKLDEPVDFSFVGAEGHKVQGWVFRPPGFHESDKRKWPIIFAIHGGPQSAWEDQWSTRWNLNVLAQQGYVVAAINPTGSTTFGQDFTDGISGDWGGRPFVDLRKGWDHLKKHWHQVDFDRAVAAGASWGGYAINWIAGHPEWEFNFKALFCHDGVFDTLYMGLSTEELYFFENEFSGPAYTRKTYHTAEKFNPARLVHKWSTPMLIVHGSKDYRLPETEGLSVFHALQRSVTINLVSAFRITDRLQARHQEPLKWHWEVLRWFDLHVGAGPKSVQ
ncbi:alpha/beta-hydrolase [Auriculariales sp. MPI-PUGE-AT-0066]|nr:alpha/beta-hydrolase [Auriculariales sp. MPI-PUGE-AT-0066]